MLFFWIFPSDRHFTTSNALFLVVDVCTKLATRNFQKHSTKIRKLFSIMLLECICSCYVKKLLDIFRHQSYFYNLDQIQDCIRWN